MIYLYNDNSDNKWSKNFDKKPHQVEWIFHTGKLMWQQLLGSNAVGCNYRTDAVANFFAAVYTAVT